MSGSDGKRAVWEVLYGHVVEGVKECDEIGQQGFGLNFFGEDKEEVVREVLSEYPYLLMQMTLWYEYWKNQLERMNMKADEENGQDVGMVNGRDQKVWQFSSNEFGKNIGCLVSAPTFDLGGYRLWDKEEAQKMSGKKRNRRLIRVKVDLYEVFLSYIIYCLLLYIMNIPTPLFLPDLCHLSQQGKGVHEVLATRIKFGRGKGLI